MKNNPGRMISILYRKGNIYKNEHLKDINLTASEHPFLNALYKNDGCSQEDLSNTLNIDKASTTRAIQSLLSKGLVVKTSDEKDRRVNRIYLTDQAKSIKDDLYSVLHSWEDTLTEGMTDEEKDLVYSYLFKMVQNTEKYFNENSKEKSKKGNISNND